jgi:diaminohydroxyphosphoribosylaminopyrimidine deaminase/5-amino-6-(5-phosphoribosylamino)uracil reductase
MQMNVDERFMFRCLELASHGLGTTAPNPMVGAVLVHGDRIIGEGYHQACGGPHAEVNCLDSVSKDDRHLISESTLYVSLEPCAHHGRTPPCADRIIREGIREVVVAARDPFPLVDGKGIELLESAGVRVRLGTMEKEAISQNKRFLTFHRKRRPYIILKWAQTSDGMIADAGPRQVSISGEATRTLVHQWRFEEAAIMVGSQTVLTDNPRLTVRPASKTKQPVRIIVDPSLRVGRQHHVFDGEAPLIICNTLKAGVEGHVTWLQVPALPDLLPSILEGLYKTGIHSILVEGGRVLLDAFLRLGTWDEIRRITASGKQLPGGYAGPSFDPVEPPQIQQVGSDIIETFIHG